MKKLILFLFLAVLTIKSFGATVTLAWDANTDGATGYKLYGYTGGTTSQLALVTGILTTTDTVTVTNANWTFWATAINNAGEESLPSNAVLASVLPSPAVVIQSPTVLYTGNGLYQASFSWTPSPAEYYVTNYIAKLTKSGVSVGIQNTGTNRVASFTSLVDGSYSFTVTPVNFEILGTVAFQNFSIVRLGNPKNFRVKIN
jgi:hypothetical protein